MADHQQARTLVLECQACGHRREVSEDWLQAQPTPAQPNVAGYVPREERHRLRCGKCGARRIRQIVTEAPTPLPGKARSQFEACTACGGDGGINGSCWKCWGRGFVDARPVPEPQNAPRSYTIHLSQQDWDALNHRFPRTQGSSDIGKRAVEILRCHFMRVDPGCEFVAPPRGADLAIRSAEGTKVVAFEVKGTADSGIAWPQLKLSSQSSFEFLSSGRGSVLRVTKVFEKEPEVFELRHGVDFTLVPEARWTFKPVR